MSPPVCGICGDPLPWHTLCDRAHKDHCHTCWAANLHQGFDAVEHPAPRAAHALSAREQQAVQTYTQHVRAVTGTGPLADLLVLDEEDG